MKTKEYVIGDGIYTAADMAYIFKLPYHQVYYWFSVYALNKLEKANNFKYHFKYDNETAVNFKTIIEFYIFNVLKKKGFSYGKIFAAHGALSKYLNTPYPFSRAKLVASGNSIYAELDDNIISADGKFQVAIEKIVKQFSAKLDYEDELAVRFYPLGKTSSIVVDPAIRYGLPTIKGTRLNPKTIFQYHQGGDKVDDIARNFEISSKEVLDAIEFSKAA